MADHAEALLTVLRKGAVGRSYNIGGGNEVKNIDLVLMIRAILDRKRLENAPYADLVTFVADRPSHDLGYAINPKRISKELEWPPSVTVGEDSAPRGGRAC